jgi:hypothetical protein
MGKTMAMIVLYLTGVAMAFAQYPPGSQVRRISSARREQVISVRSHDLGFKKTSALPFFKRKSEWQHIIDSTWGPGLPLAQKLSVFDYYSSYIRGSNPTFGYTNLNWDSVSAYWRSKITDSTSQGRFSAILSYLARELKDGHAFAWDNIMNTTPLNPGTPIVVDLTSDGFYGVGAVSHFGAGLTPLPDSSLLVYMVVPNHPLGLEPGDIVLGYEGIPWKNLIRELMAAGIPFLGRTGSSASSNENCLLLCAGENWHLFDTIDVVKYKTAQTVHLSTDTMISLQPVGGLVNGGQLPVKGVPMPGWAVFGGSTPTLPPVSYGIVQGTSIGYIYVYHESDDVEAEFKVALAALAPTRGLVIDLRFNTGGDYYLGNEIASLTSYAGTTLQDWTRSSPTDLLALVPYPTYYTGYVIPQDNMSYQFPVAVLLGPACRSAGDALAWQLRYLDNVRFFGKSSQMILGGYDHVPLQAPAGSFTLECPDFVTVDQHSPSTQLWGREFPVDEDSWLTPDGVAKGVDDVVQHALTWITSLTYAHDVTIARSYTGTHLDSISVTATLSNSLNHSAALSAIVTDTSGIVRDSISLYNDGKHGDGQAADSVWGCRIPVPSDKGLFAVTVRTDDISQGSYRKLPKIVGFATAGPLTLSSVSVANVLGGDGKRLTPYVRNNDSSFTVRGAMVTFRCNDPWVTGIGAGQSLPDLPPSATAGSTSPVLIYFDPTAKPTYFDLKADFSIGGVIYWTDSTRLTLTGIGTEAALPVRYALEQNYPNPFNPSTKIQFSIVHRQLTIVKVFDVLGREVATLVNELKEPGTYTVQFNASSLASGVYFYRLQAGNFVQTKKLLLLR